MVWVSGCDEGVVVWVSGCDVVLWAARSRGAGDGWSKFFSLYPVSESDELEDSSSSWSESDELEDSSSSWSEFDELEDSSSSWSCAF